MKRTYCSITTGIAIFAISAACGDGSGEEATDFARLHASSASEVAEGTTARVDGSPFMSEVFPECVDDAFACSQQPDIKQTLDQMRADGEFVGVFEKADVKKSSSCFNIFRSACESARAAEAAIILRCVGTYGGSPTRIFHWGRCSRFNLRFHEGECCR